MDKQALERKCIDLHGEETGRRLFEAMMKLHKKDFCVATAWSDPLGVSIAQGCSSRGRIFKLTPDYKCLIMPNRDIIPLERLSYASISVYLPERGPTDEGYEHCHHDKDERASSEASES